MRDESKRIFETRNAQLKKQKDALFKKQDVLAWRVDKEHQIAAESAKSNPVEAYKFILPDVNLFCNNFIDYKGGRELKRGDRVLYKPSVQRSKENNDE